MLMLLLLPENALGNQASSNLFTQTLSLDIDRPEPAASEPTVASLMVTIIDQQREIDRLNQCVSELDMALLRARNTNVELVASFFKSNFPNAKLADCSF